MILDVCAKFLDNVGAKNFLEMIDFIAAVLSIKKSSKSEPSSRFLRRLKFLAGFWFVRGEGGVSKSRIDPVFGPPWREDYRREVT